MNVKYEQVKQLTKALQDKNKDEIIKHVKNLNSNFNILLESEDYVQCKLCGKILRTLSEHLIFFHDISSILYKKIFPFSEIHCLKTLLKQSLSIRKTNSRNIRFDTSDPSIELETRFNSNRVRAYSHVAERDKFCQECETSEGIFDVHHTIPQRLFDRYDLEQDDLDNLIYLCKKCHSVYGQRLDDIVLDIFEICIKLQFQFTHQIIIRSLKETKKSFLKRRPGTPAIYSIDKEDLELYAENSIVDVKEASEGLKINEGVVKRFCREYDLAFSTIFESEKKTLISKQCPCCNWSGAFKISVHILQTKDDVHLKFLEEIKQKYLELGSAQNVADYYYQFNFTKVIVTEILDNLGVLKKLNCKEYVCPACAQNFRYIVRHLNEMKDDEHKAFCDKLKNEYFVQNKSMSLICKELSLEMNLVNGYLKDL
jgi:hypothetical protein